MKSSFCPYNEISILHFFVINELIQISIFFFPTHCLILVCISFLNIKTGHLPKKKTIKTGQNQSSGLVSNFGSSIGWVILNESWQFLVLKCGLNWHSFDG